jgi:hypothetical protein
MFSVNNFYDFLDSHYGWHQTQSMLWRFYPDGSKQLFESRPYYDSKKIVSDEFFKWSMGGVILLHDQEPIKLDLLTTYRQFRYDLKKDPLWLDHNPKDLLLMHTRSIEWPIFCHSELNSAEVRQFRDLGLIDCYYFYHGFIARDWFRHWRHHRCTPAHQQRFLLYAREFTGSREYRRHMVELLSLMQDQIRYNWDGKDAVASDYSAKIVMADAEQAAIHLVAETLFDTNKIYITEKAFKPMVMRQPFLMFAAPGTLATLRGYGFQTFSSIWDESYDSEMDHEARMSKIVGEINKLYTLPNQEFSRILARCQDIVEHNHRHFYSNEFEKLMLDELHANMQASIAEQKSRIQKDPGGSFYHMMDGLHQQGIQPTRLMVDWAQGMTQYMNKNLPERFAQVVAQYPRATQYL